MRKTKNIYMKMIFLITVLYAIWNVYLYFKYTKHPNYRKTSSFYLLNIFDMGTEGFGLALAWLMITVFYLIGIFIFA